MSDYYRWYKLSKKQSLKFKLEHIVQNVLNEVMSSISIVPPLNCILKIFFLFFCFLTFELWPNTAFNSVDGLFYRNTTESSIVNPFLIVYIYTLSYCQIIDTITQSILTSFTYTYPLNLINYYIYIININ